MQVTRVTKNNHIKKRNYGGQKQTNSKTTADEEVIGSPNRKKRNGGSVAYLANRMG